MKGYEGAKHHKLYLNGKPLEHKCFVANTHIRRLCGLIPVKKLEEDEALAFFGSCEQMHSFFMNYPIDLVFLDSKNKIIALQTLKPWRLSGFYFRAKAVIEFKEGFNDKHETRLGDQLEVRL